MGIVVGILAMKAKRIALLEAKLHQLYAEHIELQRLEQVNAREQRIVYNKLVKLGARGKL